MDKKKFEKLCKDLLAQSNKTLFDKSQEYASDDDRLANFRQPTAMMDMSTAEVCLMYQMKHIASISKMAKESSQGILPTKALLKEKCQDMINYTLIFYTAMMEMIEEENAIQKAAEKEAAEMAEEPQSEVVDLDEPDGDEYETGFLETEIK